jgi:hypothetical protein
VSEPRTLAERTAHVRAALSREVDCWLATADDAGIPYLVPLSFLWDGSTILLATGASSRTGRNLARAVPVRLAVGSTRDVILVEGEVEVVGATVSAEAAAAYASHTGWDPRASDGNAFAGRDVLRGGRWLVDG